jgi:predicted cobalt transporter CbtA
MKPQTNNISFRIFGVSMSKILELIGFALIGGTIYSFLGMTNDPLRWPVFWGCAGGALAIIIYNRTMRKRKQTS